MTYRELREMEMTEEQLDQNITVLTPNQEVFESKCFDFAENVCPGIAKDGTIILIL